jgi:hypothetical protein
VLDALIVLSSLWLASWLQPELRRLFPQLRAAVQFREHALLVYLVTPLWLWLIVSLRLHLAVPLRFAQAELITGLIKPAPGRARSPGATRVSHAVADQPRAFPRSELPAALCAAQHRHRLGAFSAQVPHRAAPPLASGSAVRTLNELVRAALAAPDPPHFIGFLSAADRPPLAAGELSRVGTLSDLPRVLHEHAIDHVLFFPPANQPESVRTELQAGEDVGVTASFSVELVQLSEAMPVLAEHYERVRDVRGGAQGTSAGTEVRARPHHGRLSDRGPLAGFCSWRWRSP